MTVILRSRLCRTLYWLLMAAFIATLVPVAAGPVRAQEEGPRKILVLPVSDHSGRGDARLSRWISDDLVLGITGKQGLAGLDFSATSPLVRRAISEGRVLPAQVETAPPSPSAAVVIGHALGADAVLQVTVEILVITEYPKQAKISLAGELYAVGANFNTQTGEASATPTSERTFKVVGESRLVTQYAGSDQPLIKEAVREAVGQVARAIAGEEATAPKAPSRKRNTSWIAAVLVVGLLALVISGAKSDNRAPQGALPPVPVSLVVQTGGIQLTWRAPQVGDLTLLRYQIQRSVNGQPYQFIDGGLVGPGATSFFDNNVTSGERYRYRIAAVYTTQAVSAYANFTQIIFPPASS